MVVLAAASAACGSSGEAAEGELVDPPETTTPTTVVPETTTPTTAVPPLVDDGPVDFDSTFDPLVPGTTYLTNTAVPFSFTVGESETKWWAAVADTWSATMVFANMDAGGSLSGPQLSLGVAEPGATRDSVVAAMMASAEPLNYESSDGLFGGRDAIILDGSLEDRVSPRPRPILTGEDSSIEVIFETGRSYRSHVFEEDGRVFIVSVEALGELSVVLAEAAPIFESLEIGGAA